MGIASHAIQRYAGDVSPSRAIFHLLDTRHGMDRQARAHRKRNKRRVNRNSNNEEAAGDTRSPAASVRVLWRCPTLPQPGGCSTIGAAGLSFQVRNGGWAFPRCYDHHKFWCSTRSPAPLFVLVGVWVDRGLYSGCGTKSLFVSFCLPGLLGCCLVLAH